MEDLVFVKKLEGSCRHFKVWPFIKSVVIHKLHEQEVLNMKNWSLDLRIQSRPSFPALLRVVVPKASFSPKVFSKIGNLEKFKTSYKTDIRLCTPITAE